MQMSFVVTVLVLALTTSPAAGVYFNRMMSCEQFCQMLTKDYVRQVWCVIGICREKKMYRNIVKYAKRDQGEVTDDDDSYWSKRDISPRFYLPLLNSLDKRDKEFWTGPTPADE